MLSSLKLYIAAGVGAAILATYFYIDKLQTDLRNTQDEVAVLMQSIAVSEESVRQLSNQLEVSQENLRVLTVKLQKAEKYGDELRATLNAHNLTYLATQKPGLIEKRIQNATDQIWNDISSITTNDGVQLANP